MDRMVKVSESPLTRRHR